MTTKNGQPSKPRPAAEVGELAIGVVKELTTSRGELERRADALSFAAMTDPGALAELTEVESQILEIDRARDRAVRAHEESERLAVEERQQQARDAVVRWLRRLEKAAADLMAAAVQRETCQANQAEKAQKTLMAAWSAFTAQADQMELSVPQLMYRIAPRLDRLAGRPSFQRELASMPLDQIVRSPTDGVLRKARRLLKEGT